MTRTGDASEQSARTPGWKWYWNVFGLLFMGVGVFVLFIPFWESIGVESIRCEVVSAEPRTSSGGSRGSASTAGVLVETSDCGSISVSQGVTFDNREEVAASFKPGSEYEFDIGWFSRVVMEDVLGQGYSARDYRLVK